MTPFKQKVSNSPPLTVDDVLSDLAIFASWWGYDKHAGTEGKHTSSTIDEAGENAKAALSKIVDEIIGEDEDIGVDPEWPWSKVNHRDKLRAEQRARKAKLFGEEE